MFKSTILSDTVYRYIFYFIPIRKHYLVWFDPCRNWISDKYSPSLLVISRLPIFKVWTSRVVDQHFAGKVKPAVPLHSDDLYLLITHKLLIQKYDFDTSKRYSKKIALELKIIKSLRMITMIKVQIVIYFKKNVFENYT